MLEGLHPNRPTHVFRLTTDERSARVMTELIGEIFDPAETAVASFETEDGGPWLLEAYFAREPDEAAIRDLVRPLVGAEADKGVFLPLTQQDWIKSSLEGLTPVRAGRVLVHGSHDREQRRPNDLAIEIEAALAFGTGHHGTTKGCLQAFVDELKLRRPRHVLDVGTGTGILAFAAAKTLKQTIVAGDIDPEAVRVARGNARLNGIDQWLSLYVGPGVRNAKADRPGHFDLVFANILAKPLRILAPSLARVTAPDGTLILSGLLLRDVPGILSAYAPQGFSLQRRYELEGWAALVLKRGGTHPRRRRG
ncbi:50S ribosomal protein L11 methyltransferase [Microvirga antarctica]|uniref:50S ribosomal protein L11 methyltransferase n=1 Tax=Microvirga antarctica TaxID=2819233 RepID=UPI001B309692|nr:50S ribosomal protein L11 methyltransferase [Microvirga antarctica]